jgi:maltose O-acetyltransferase
MPHRLPIGDKCVIAEFCHIWGGGGFDIGNKVLVAAHVTITSMTHDAEAAVFADTSVKKPVVIEDNVWIGTGAIIMPGICLGTGYIIGAGAEVTKNVPANCIVAGIPARYIRERVPTSTRY